MTKSAPRFTHTTSDGEIVERVSVYVPKGLKGQFQRLAKSRGQSLTYAVAAAIQAAVEQNTDGAE